jgi:RNA polymerase sigma-70 factor (sigma-E family)
MGPDETLGQLMTECGDRLLRLAYQLTHDRSTAEDVVQEALVSMYRSWRRSMPELNNIEGYARRAVVNQFLGRRRLRSSSEIATAVPPETAGLSFDDGVVDRDAVWQALGALPARQRAVLVLRFYEDLPDVEIAAVLDAREGTVRSLASRGLLALRSSALVLDGEPT